MSAAPHLRRYAMVLPFAGLIVLMLLVPIGFGLWDSFHAGGLYSIEQSFSFDNYSDTLGNDVFWTAIRTSLFVGLTTAVVATLLGGLVAHHIRFSHPERRTLILGALLLGVVGGYLVRIYAWRTLLGENGVINSAALELNLVGAPIRGLLFSTGAIVLALGSIYVPYTALMISAALSNVRDDQVEAARDLGATRLGSYRKVVLPMIGRPLLAAFTLVFLLSAADYVVPPLLGGARTQMIGALVVNALVAEGDAPKGAAIAFCGLAVLIIATAIIWALGKAAGLLPRGGR